MLKLQKRDETRVTLDDDGAFVVLDPITPKMRRRAFRIYRDKMEAAGADYDSIDPDLARDLAELVSLELIRMGAREWGGIGDADGKAIDLTPDQATRMRTATDPKRPTGTIDDLLADDDIVARLDADYVRPDADRRAEKNGFAGSPNGTSAKATPGSGTANSAAKRTSTGGARNARTKSTRRKAKTAKASGKR